MKQAFMEAARKVPSPRPAVAPPPVEDKEEEEEEGSVDDDGDLLAEAKRRRKHLRHIEKDQVMYVAGEDAEGRSVLVVVGSRIPPISDQRLYHILLYLTLILDKIAQKEYVLVYCHTKASFKSSYFAWMNKAKDRLPHHFRKNLAACHIVHPSFFIKSMFAFMRPFISAKFWKKLFYYSRAKTTDVEGPVAPLKLASMLPPFVIM